MPISFKNPPALVVYVTCGDPDLDSTRDIVLAAAEAGADVIELGVPFSDPVSDGPVIQRASERALRNGTTLAQVLELGRGLRKRSDVALIIFSYLNPILRFGMSRFCTAAADAGIDGALVTDLTVEEAGDYIRCMRARELDTIFLAAPTSPDDRLKRIADASRGFVYAVSRTGVTGARKQISEDAQSLVRRLRRFTKLPIAVGFGISTPEQFAEVGQYADGVVVGSAIVEVIERAARGQAADAVAAWINNLVGSTQKEVAAAKMQ
jgi:tryptophan synthase alpha chain